jgi:hypothetical protein
MIDIINSIHKLPIVIVATPRSGSSWLGKRLAKHYNVDWLCEPWNSKENCIKLEQNYIDSTPYVTKFLIHQLPALEMHQTILNSDCFKIKLSRNNLIDQVVSLYIARKREIWSQPVKSISEYIVPVDLADMSICIAHLIYYTKMLNDCEIKFDLELSYEMLDFEECSDNTNFKTSQPTNIGDIYKLASNLIVMHNKYNLTL